MFFKIILSSLCPCFLFCAFCDFVLFCVLFLLLYAALSLLIFLPVYRPLPSSGNPIAVNKYHSISHGPVQRSPNVL